MGRGVGAETVLTVGLSGVFVGAGVGRNDGRGTGIGVGSGVGRGVGAASSEKVEQWFAELDSDGDGGIDSAEFARLGEVVRRRDELR